MTIASVTRTAYTNGTIADAVAANANEDALTIGLNAAIAAVNGVSGYTGKFVANTVSITSTTSASTLGYTAINMVSGGQFVVSAGVTFTIDVPFSCGDFPCFSGDGTVIFTETAGAVNPTWFYVDEWGEAIQRASDASHVLEFQPKEYDCSTEIVVTNYPQHWYGAGRTAVGGTYLKAIGGQSSIVNLSKSGSTYNALSSSFSGLYIQGDGITTDQHAFLISKNMGTSTWDKIGFASISGYCFAINVNASTGIPSGTMQSVHMSDITASAIGGYIGYTEEPAASAAVLAITSLQMDNCHCESGILQISPQLHTFDFRGIRNATITGLITEGTYSHDSIMALGTDGWIKVNGWFAEYTTSFPTNLVKAYADATNAYYSKPKCQLTMENITANGTSLHSPPGIEIEENSGLQCVVRTWYAYYANELTDLIKYTPATSTEFNPKIDLYNLITKTPFKVSEDLMGKVTIHSHTLYDNGFGLSRSQERIASWRPSDGHLADLKSPFFSVSVNSSYLLDGYGHIEADATDTTTLVERFTGKTTSTRAMPRITFAPVLPTDWVGSDVTMVIRYRIDVDPADTGVTFNMLYTGGVGAKSTGQSGSSGLVGAWETVVFTGQPTSETSFVPYSRVLTGTPTTSVVVRIASVDLYRGSYYCEPYDLTHVDGQRTYFTTGTTAPAAVPEFTSQEHFDTTNNVFWKAFGTDTGDWKGFAPALKTVKDMAIGSATDLFNVVMGGMTAVGGLINYVIRATDDTNYQAVSGKCRFTIINVAASSAPIVYGTDFSTTYFTKSGGATVTGTNEITFAADGDHVRRTIGAYDAGTKLRFSASLSGVAGETIGFRFYDTTPTQQYSPTITLTESPTVYTWEVTSAATSASCVVYIYRRIGDTVETFTADWFKVEDITVASAITTVIDSTYDSLQAGAGTLTESFAIATDTATQTATISSSATSSLTETGLTIAYTVTTDGANHSVTEV